MSQNQHNNLQTTIIFKHNNQIKRHDICGNTFEIFFPKRISLKSTEFITINTGVEVQIPDEVIGLPPHMPIIEILKLARYKLNHLRRQTKLVFNFLNKSIDKTFTFRKNSTIGVLMLLNARSDETFRIEYSKSSTRKKRGKS